jgi:hypothetical protein
MIKGRGRSQIGNLTPNHKPIEIKGQMKSNWGVLFTVDKIFLKAIRYCPHYLNIYLTEKDMNVQIFGTTRVPKLGPPSPFGSPEEN